MVVDAFPRRRRCLVPPSPTAGDGQSIAFRGQAAGIFPPPAAAAKVRKTSREGRGRRRRRGAAREEGTEGRVGGGRAMALRTEQQASALSTIDSQDSIGLLTIMIAISYQASCEINPILSDPSSRRWSNKKTSMKHNFGQQKGQEKQCSTFRRQKKALVTDFSDLSSDLFSGNIRRRYAP